MNKNFAARLRKLQETIEGEGKIISLEGGEKVKITHSDIISLMVDAGNIQAAKHTGDQVNLSPIGQRMKQAIPGQGLGVDLIREWFNENGD